MEVCRECIGEEEIEWWGFGPGDVLEWRGYDDVLHKDSVSQYYLVVRVGRNEPKNWRLYGLATGNIWDEGGPSVWAHNFRKVNACLKIKE